MSRKKCAKTDESESVIFRISITANAVWALLLAIMWAVYQSPVSVTMIDENAQMSGSHQFESSTKLNSNVEISPYMDEIFHIPQAQRFCERFLPDASFHSFGIETHQSDNKMNQKVIGSSDCDKQICAKIWGVSWDPKITTLPGIYLFSVLLETLRYYTIYYLNTLMSNIQVYLPTKLLMRGMSFMPAACTVTDLRLHNIFLAFLIFPLCIWTRKRWIMQSCMQLQGTAKGPTSVCIHYDAIVVASLCVLYPALAGYYSLYYTEALSSCCLILTYALCLTRKTDTNRRLQQLWESFLLCCSATASILARQTNAGWCLFCFGALVLRELRVLRQYVDQPDTPISMQKLLQSIWNTGPRLLCQLQLWAVLLPVAAFGVFVVGWNGGSLVVGDKDHHAVVRHLAMPLHAFGTLCVLLLPIVVLDTYLSTPPGLLATTRKADPPHASQASTPQSSTRLWSERTITAVRHLIGVSIVCGLLLSYSHAHPFLLADNRHYMFYIWQRFLSKPWIRVGCGIIYYVLFVFVGQWYRKHANVGSVLGAGFIAVVMATLVPTPLLECRYFTPVVLFGLLHMPPLIYETSLTVVHSVVSCRRLYGAMAVAFCMMVADTVLCYVFVKRPFIWQDGSEARFML